MGFKYHPEKNAYCFYWSVKIRTRRKWYRRAENQCGKVRPTYRWTSPGLLLKFCRSSALLKSELLTLIRIELLNIYLTLVLILVRKRGKPNSHTRDNHTGYNFK